MSSRVEEVVTAVVMKLVLEEKSNLEAGPGTRRDFLSRQLQKNAKTRNNGRLK